jgi:DNA repair exonuclease SbcCD ATPase subunit
MKILELGMKGFKKYKESTVIKFTDKTVIPGENETGKTSIGEAIVWAFYGTNLFGNTKADSKLINDDGCTTMQVQIIFLDEDGNKRVLKRNRGAQTQIKLDNFQKTQKEIDEIFGSKDLFLTLFNPEYFFGLSDLEAREFILRYLKEIPTEKVYAEMSETEKDLLSNTECSGDINVALTRLRGKLKENEKNKEYLNGRMDAALISQNKLIIPEEKVFLDKELKNDEAKLEKLNTVSEGMLEKQKDLNSIQKEVNNLKMELNSLTSQKNMDEKMFMQKKESLREKYNLTKKLIKEIGFKEGESCPQCTQKILQQTVSTIKQSIDAENATTKKQLDEFIAEGNRNKTIFETKQKEIMATSEQIKICISEVEKIITSLESEIKNNTQNSEEKAKLSQNIKLAKAQKTETEKANAQRHFLLKQKEENGKTIKTLEKSLIANDEEIILTNKKLEAMKRYANLRMKMVDKEISENLHRVSIKLALLSIFQ